MSKLSAEQVGYYLKNLPQWKFENNSLTKTFQRKNFNDAIALVNAVAELAEKANHHPEMKIQYDRVTFILTTHDRQGVTGKDFLLAQQIDALK